MHAKVVRRRKWWKKAAEQREYINSCLVYCFFVWSMEGQNFCYHMTVYAWHDNSWMTSLCDWTTLTHHRSTESWSPKSNMKFFPFPLNIDTLHVALHARSRSSLVVGLLIYMNTYKYFRDFTFEWSYINHIGSQKSNCTITYGTLNVTSIYIRDNLLTKGHRSINYLGGVRQMRRQGKHKIKFQKVVYNTDL